MSEQESSSRYRDSWNARYDRPEYVFGTAPNDFLAEVASRIPPGAVLSMAEGEGRNAVYLAGLGYQVTAVDQSEVGLAKAALLADGSGVSLATVVSDLARFAIAPGAWAGIISIFLHIPTAIRADLYRRAVVGLQPGGVFILEAYTPRQIALGTGGPRDPELTPTLDQLRAELAGLNFEIGIERQREVIEGIGHTGTGEVVQVLARKPTTT
jgi:SAM-dependent methyltransferase